MEARGHLKFKEFSKITTEQTTDKLKIQKKEAVISRMVVITLKDSHEPITAPTL